MDLTLHCRALLWRFWEMPQNKPSTPRASLISEGTRALPFVTSANPHGNMMRLIISILLSTLILVNSAEFNTNPRVRREWRTLTPEMRQKVAE